MENINLLLHAGLLLCGAGFIGMGLYIILRCRKLRQHGLVREAVVVFSQGRSKGAAPTLEYITANGAHQVRSRFPRLRPLFPFKEGDSVRIFYDQSNFKRFYIEGDRVPTLLALLMLLLGGVAVHAAVGVSLELF